MIAPRLREQYEAILCHFDAEPASSSLKPELEELRTVHVADTGLRRRLKLSLWEFGANPRVHIRASLGAIPPRGKGSAW